MRAHVACHQRKINHPPVYTVHTHARTCKVLTAAFAAERDVTLDLRDWRARFGARRCTYGSLAKAAAAGCDDGRGTDKVDDKVERRQISVKKNEMGVIFKI